MKVYVTYNLIDPEKPEADISKIKNQFRSDVSWGSGDSNFKAINQLFKEGNTSWKRYRPNITKRSENEKGFFELGFNEDFFNFKTEGVNHFIGTVAGDVLLNKTIKKINVDDFRIENAKEYFPGPNYGIKGVYDLFENVERPLLAYSVKPRMGYNIEQFKEIFSAALDGGADIIEDDERLIDPVYCPFEERVEIASKLQTKKTYYSANITGPLELMYKRIEIAKKNNLKFVKADVLVIGFDALLAITNYIKEKKYDIRITVYPDIIGKYRDLSRTFILKMSRLCGADIIYAGSPSLSRFEKNGKDLMEECEKVLNRHKMLQDSTKDMSGIKPTLATMTNDMSIEDAEAITVIFNRCFESKKFAFFIGHGISASNNTIQKTIKDINTRITKAAKAEEDDYTIEPKGQNHALVAKSDAITSEDLRKMIREYKGER